MQPGNSMQCGVDAAGQLNSMLDGCSGPRSRLEADTSLSAGGHEFADCWSMLRRVDTPNPKGIY
jgi:hypothetical protein